tara:strand:- start:4290 stop:5780 length:1491 start_codon:yes stop_codon:yes gene_type:complete
MKISKSPLTGTEYKIPSQLDDSAAISNFVKQHNDKEIVVVQGLGFVGAVMSLVCANGINDNYAVIGVDLPSPESFWKIQSLNEGIFPLIAEDPKIEDFFNSTKIKGNFLATYDSEAYKYADVIIVDINLDVLKTSNANNKLLDFDVDMSGFTKAIKDIGKYFKEDALILVETTVPPGTCERLVKPIIEKELENRGLKKDKFRLGHSYERVMPGPNYVDSIREFPRVYSGINESSADSVEAFLKTIINTSVCELTRLNHTNATEIAKVLENSYRAMNISFAVEWSRFAEEAKVDLYSIVNAIRVRDTHSNLMYPGIGVGGYCLTKDPLLASWARKSYFGSEDALEMSINSVATNDQMPKYAFKRILNVFGNIKNKRISLLGVSYRGDVGDTRYTPVYYLLEHIKSETTHIKLHDPYISFWEEQNTKIDNDINEVISASSDLIIISTGHSEYKTKETISKLMKIPPTFIFDTIGIFTDNQLNELSKKHKLSILGRGDI